MKFNVSVKKDMPTIERQLHEPQGVAAVEAAVILAIDTNLLENNSSDIDTDNELTSLRQKVEAGRKSMRASLGRTNDEVEASFAARRTAITNQIYS